MPGKTKKKRKTNAGEKPQKCFGFRNCEYKRRTTKALFSFFKKGMLDNVGFIVTSVLRSKDVLSLKDRDISC